MDVDALLGCLSDPDAEVRALAAGILREASEIEKVQKHKTRTVQGLVVLLKDPDPRVRAQAVSALGEFHDPNAVPAVSEVLRDPDVRCRERAARTLGILHDVRAIPALIEAVRGPDEGNVRGSAALALGNLGDAARAAVPTLLEMFPHEPSEKHKEKVVLQTRNLRAEVDVGGAVFHDLPMVEQVYEIRTISTPAAAIALKQITGIDGGTTRESWRAALPSSFRPPAPAAAEPPADEAKSGP